MAYKKPFKPIVLGLCFAWSLQGAAQEVDKTNPCIADEMRMLEEAHDPAIAERRAQLEAFTQAFVAQRERSGQKMNNAVKIIPVVVHVIHDGGTENISFAQIEDGIRVLNEDFRRINIDTGKTNAPWKSIAVDSEIEFRLAQKDPNGNCTDGVTRTRSELTYQSDNSVKDLVMWPHNKYMNVWLVSNPIGPSGSSIIAFAQFPGGASSSDGLVVKYNYWGAIGVSSGAYRGRVATHEVGHWLNLRHIWGDANCGDDFVSDTPTHETSNRGCPGFPHVTCSNGPDGDQFENYMDYTNGACQNMFSNGQKSRMLAAMNSSISDRNNLWSSSNLAATGTDGAPAVLCAPHTDFSGNAVLICAGDSIKFTDESWNGAADTWRWSFQGGSPDTSTQANPTVTYNTPGTYNVTLTAGNAAGSDAETKNGYIVVNDPRATYTVMPFTDSFEDGTAFGNDWAIVNPDNGIGWARSASAGYTGASSIWLRNDVNATGQEDAIVSPSYDIDSVLSPSLKFKVAFAQNTTANNDKLKVYVSTNCTRTWALRTQKSGGQLATVSARTSEFTPGSVNDWREETVSLAPYAGATNIRFKFEFVSDGGNNIYIDDINVTGAGFVGLDESLSQSLNTQIYPNPFASSSNLVFTMKDAATLDVRIFDILGKEVVVLEKESWHNAGEHRYEIRAEDLYGHGVYFVRIRVGNAGHTQKLVVH